MATDYHVVRVRFVTKNVTQRHRETTEHLVIEGGKTIRKDIYECMLARFVAGII